MIDYYDRRNEDKSLPFFGGDDTIREILGTTPHLKASKDEIRAFFEATADRDARISYIKRIFNNDYTEVILSDGRRVGYKTYQNVLQLWEGSYLSRTAQSFYGWGVIAQYFEAMRLLGELQDTMKPLPSIDGQLSLMTAGAEERKPSAFAFSQEIKTIKAVEQTEKTIKQSARSAGKKTIKTAGKGTAKAAQRSVKTTKTAIKTTQQAAKAAQKTAQATVKASQKAAQAAKATVKATVAGVKAAVKATIAAVKAIIAATKALVAAIAAGGWVAVAVIVVICLIALICGSVFGIFFSGEDSGTGMSMQTAVQEINADYDAKMEAEKNSVAYDNMEISGGRAVWKDVLAVYAVKTNTDKDNPQEVATMDESKKQILSDIFWEMNSISSRSESHSETEITETDDGNGNIVQTETTVTKTTLYITASHLTVDEMADLYGFDAEQREYLAELLKDENNSLWAAVLYGIRYSEDQIVTVALSQVGNVGGEPYWSWYGFGSRVEWCACFVSWCADQCGYIDTGVVPKYAGCVNGVQWFKDRGQWIDGSAEPVPGMIIFFDWDNKGSSGPQDGQSDHTGIVQKVENGIVYTVEGNSGDSCRVNQYSVGHYEILGYGVPNY